MVIEVKNLFRSFGPVRAVDDVSFRLESGQICGFIGPNGAGKTTTMRVLATLDLPDRGDALFDGVSVVDYPDRVRPHIGFMPDSYGTYADLTVREYLDFFARTYKLRGKKRLDAVRQVMSFTELDTIADKDTRALSKGMRQRLSLGRTLINNPDVLILDEPAAGLDPRARIELRELLRELAADGKAVLISSHILTELGEMCDTTVIIERGTVRAAGRLDQIKEQLRVRRAEQSAPVAMATEVLDGTGADAPVAMATAAPRLTQRLTIRLIRAVDWAERLLLEQPDVTNVTVRDHVVTCEHVGGPEQLASLLARLVGAGLPVIGFAVEEEDLEDLFMALTDGGVQ
ncbi:MAG: ABC transporter ATP-binding protein [Phycisphaerae bacterium]|nr:ABC transporter ATP-binding protein [Phycisphaerae bacterium]